MIIACNVKGLNKLVLAITLPAVFLLSLLGCNSADQIPDDFIDIQELDPSISVSVRYNSTDNFMGKRIDGYHSDKIYITEIAAEALVKVQSDLKNQGLGLKVYDAYRPQKAVNHFIRWAQDLSDTLNKRDYYPEIPKSRLFELGYIAERSGHTRGSTLDLTVIELSSGDELDMGSPWDFFGEISHHGTNQIDNIQNQNRNILKNTMEKRGFLLYPNEWWHYTLENEPYPDTYFNFEVK